MLATLVLACGCGRKPDVVSLAGSTAFQQFAQKLAKPFIAQNPGMRVSVQGGGSAVGIQAALMGTVQIGMADLVTLPPEAAALTAVVVARDGIAVIVHPSNPVANLTIDQIRDVFSGKIANWKDLGGKDGPITVVSREAGSGTRTSVEQIVGRMALTENAIVQNTNGTVGETVANDANAIGYLSHGLINPKIKALDVESKPCTTEAMLTGGYPLVRPIYLLTKGAPQGNAKLFIDFILSETGQAQIHKDGLIPAK
jgi:phosphate transport system substrate-binding protein